MIIIVGLGNIGENYINTRHNAGFLAINYIVEKFKESEIKIEIEDNKKLKSIIYKTEINGEKIVLVKPTTLMNLSGLAIRKILQFYKVPTENLTVIYDDIDLKLGTIRTREKGSAGTHNGMKSIIQEIGTENFKRIKIGIESRGDKTPDIKDLSSFVLGKFNKEEIAEIEKILPKIYEEIKKSLTR